MIERAVQLFSRLRSKDVVPVKAWWNEEDLPTKRRQSWLAGRRAITPDIERGIYPFGGQTLDRSDVVWLLITHNDGAGPPEWNPQDAYDHSTKGLDLRGAILHGANLSSLPMAYLIGGLAGHEWNQATEHQRVAAVIHLEEAWLRGTDLAGSSLCGACLQKARLTYAYLERAELIEGHLELALLSASHLEGADFRRAYLEGVTFDGASLRPLGEDRFSRVTMLDGAHFAFNSFRDADLTKCSIRWTSLSGVDFFDAQLGGVDFERSNFGGRILSDSDLHRLRQWEKKFLRLVHPADLHFAAFDSRTRIGAAIIGDLQHGYPTMRGIHWGGINLTSVDWMGIKELGDEREAWDQCRASRTYGRAKQVPMLQHPRRFFSVYARMVRRLHLRRGVHWILWVRRRKSIISRSLPEVARITERDAFRRAVVAHRQLAEELRSQGMNDEANEFSYRAQRLQRQVLWREGNQGAWILSRILEVLTGYGYRPFKALRCYFVVIVVFTSLFYWIEITRQQNLSGVIFPTIKGNELIDALALSMNAFHGRGVSASNLESGDPRELVGAVEAFVGMIIEVILITTLGQRFFGK